MTLYPQPLPEEPSDGPEIIDGEFEVTEAIWEDNIDMRAFAWYNSLSTRLLTITNVPAPLHDYIVNFRKFRRQDAKEHQKDINANILGMCDALRTFRTRSGETLVALLYRHAHDDDAKELESMLQAWAIEAADKVVLKLLSYFESVKNRNPEVASNAKQMLARIQDTGDINTLFDFHSSNPEKPPRKETFIMWLCRTYCTEKNYILLGLVEELLSIPGIDTNILNRDKETLLVMIQGLYAKYEPGTQQKQNAADLRNIVEECNNDLSLSWEQDGNMSRSMRERLAENYVRMASMGMNVGSVSIRQ